MKKFFKNKLAVTILVLSVGFLSIIGYGVSKSGDNVVANTIGTASNAVQKFIYTVGTEVKGFFSNVFSVSSIDNENEELRIKNQELNKKAIAYDNMILENSRLRSLLDFKEVRGEYNYIGADITGVADSQWNNTFILNKGKKDGLVEGLVAITPNGVAGVVTNVHDNWSELESLVSPNTSIASYIAPVQKNITVPTDESKETEKDASTGHYLEGEYIKVPSSENISKVPNGILKGSNSVNKNKATCEVKYIEMTAEVSVGDIVLTSGLGRIYPKDIVIGRVHSVVEDKGKNMKIVTVKPNVDYNSLNEVLIVVPKDIDLSSGEVKY